MFRWELEDLAREQLTGMPRRIQLALLEFMDAVVMVDPAGVSAAGAGCLGSLVIRVTASAWLQLD